MSAALYSRVAKLTQSGVCLCVCVQREMKDRNSWDTHFRHISYQISFYFIQFYVYIINDVILLILMALNSFIDFFLAYAFEYYFDLDSCWVDNKNILGKSYIIYTFIFLFVLLLNYTYIVDKYYFRYV